MDVAVWPDLHEFCRRDIAVLPKLILKGCNTTWSRKFSSEKNPGQKQDYLIIKENVMCNY